jgi:high-affinity iron transporter
MMDWTTALPVFAIALREGTEAALVVGIVLACLAKAGQQSLYRWVWAGVLLGICLSGIGGGLLTFLTDYLAQLDRPDTLVWQELWKGGTSLVTIGMLSWMLIWMTTQAQGLRAQVVGEVDRALQQASGWPILGLVSIAILREGLETALFTVSQAQSGWSSVAGVVGGLLTAALLALLLFRWGIKINLRQFFQVMGVILLLIVSGLVVSTLQHLDLAAGYWSQLHPAQSICLSAESAVCNLGQQVWDLHEFLPDRGFPGVFLKVLLGYRDRLYVLQLVAYMIFMVTVGGLYFQSLHPGKSDRHQTPSH